MSTPKVEPVKPLVDLNHRPDGGEVRGMRETMDRFASNLIQNGASPDYAKRVAREQAESMERRMGRK